MLTMRCKSRLAVVFDAYLEVNPTPLTADLPLVLKMVEDQTHMANAFTSPSKGKVKVNGTTYEYAVSRGNIINIDDQEWGQWEQKK